MMGSLQGLPQSNEGEPKRQVHGQLQVHAVSSDLEAAILHSTLEAESCGGKLNAQGLGPASRLTG